MPPEEDPVSDSALDGACVSSVEDPHMPPDNPAVSDIPPQFTRSGRQRRVPKRHLEFIPTSLRDIPSHIRSIYEAKMKKDASTLPLPPLTPKANSEVVFSPASNIDASEDDLEPDPEIYNTEPNEFGVFRQYTTFPIVDPEASKPRDTFIDSPLITKSSQPENDSEYCAALRCSGRTVASGLKKNVFAPFQNMSSFHIMSWFYNGSTTKSAADANILVRNHLLAEDFTLEDLRDFRIESEMARLDNYDPTSEVLTAEDGWHQGTLEFPVPREGHKAPSVDDALTFKVEGFWYRKLTDVIRSAFEEPSAKHFHYIPFKQYWYPPPIAFMPHYSPLPFTSSAAGPSAAGPSNINRRRATVDDDIDEYDANYSRQRTSNMQGTFEDDIHQTRHVPKGKGKGRYFPSPTCSSRSNVNSPLTTMVHVPSACGLRYSTLMP